MTIGITGRNSPTVVFPALKRTDQQFQTETLNSE